MKVLLIEDEEATRLLIRVNFAIEGIELLESADGATGIELARSAKPAIILLDVRLPVLDGWQIGRELKDDPLTRDIPLVYLSADAQAEDRERGLRIGAVDYITKPFDPTTLARHMKRLAGAARSRNLPHTPPMPEEPQTLATLKKARSLLLILLATCHETLLALEAAANVLDTDLTHTLATMVERSEAELKVLNAKISDLTT